LTIPNGQKVDAGILRMGHRTMTSLIPAVFDAFAFQIRRIRARLTDSDPDVAFLAKNYFETLASKSGNDILESLLVRATGREVKSVNQKHGADSADGELEAKPMKCGYSAHISDDTPASLLRHQQIPWIILGEACNDGTELKWACLAPYRIFDEERFQTLVAELPAEKRTEFTTLPSTAVERYATLVALKRAWPTKQYVRSSPLSYKTLVGLQPGTYSLWTNSAVQNTDEILKMINTVPITPAVIAETEWIRYFFETKATSDYSDMNATRLKALCKEKGIKGFSTKSKDELIALLNA
jgi:hypothetical protein